MGLYKEPENWKRFQMMIHEVEFDEERDNRLKIVFSNE